MTIIRRVVGLLAAALIAFGLGAATAAATPQAASTSVVEQAVSGAPAAVPAGNGTNNFYLHGYCYPNVGGPTLGVTFRASNWDNGANQQYRTTWTRSGIAYSIRGIYIDGVYKGRSSDMTHNIAGHGRHTLKIVTDIFGSPQSCAFGL